MKLTARQVDTSKPKDKPYKLSDGGGLYLLVNPNGSRYWRLKYRIAGKEKLLALGHSKSSNNQLSPVADTPSWDIFGTFSAKSSQFVAHTQLNG